jgi:hypothetical protein
MVLSLYCRLEQEAAFPVWRCHPSCSGLEAQGHQLGRAPASQLRQQCAPLQLFFMRASRHGTAASQQHQQADRTSKPTASKQLMRLAVRGTTGISTGDSAGGRRGRRCTGDDGGRRGTGDDWEQYIAHNSRALRWRMDSAWERGYSLPEEDSAPLQELGR